MWLVGVPDITFKKLEPIDLFRAKNYSIFRALIISHAKQEALGHAPWWERNVWWSMEGRAVWRHK